MNTNTVSFPKQVPQELNNGGTSTSEVVFVSSATTSALNPTASDPVVCPLPKNLAGVAATAGTFNQGTAVYNAAFTASKGGALRTTVKFKVIAFGRVITNGSYNFTAKLAYGTSATTTSNTSIATSGTIALTAAIGKTNWYLQLDLVYDADSQRINGNFSGQVHTTTVSPTTISNALTAVDLTSTTALGFVASGTFGTGHANNKCYLDGFFLLID